MRVERWARPAIGFVPRHGCVFVCLPACLPACQPVCVSVCLPLTPSLSLSLFVCVRPCVRTCLLVSWFCFVRCCCSTLVAAPPKPQIGTLKVQIHTGSVYISPTTDLQRLPQRHHATAAAAAPRTSVGHFRCLSGTRPRVGAADAGFTKGFLEGAYEGSRIGYGLRA